jgi:hypothetical protein
MEETKIKNYSKPHRVFPELKTAEKFPSLRAQNGREVLWSNRTRVKLKRSILLHIRLKIKYLFQNHMYIVLKEIYIVLK